MFPDWELAVSFLGRPVLLISRGSFKSVSRLLRHARNHTTVLEMHNWPNQSMQRTASRHGSPIRVPRTQSTFPPYNETLPSPRCAAAIRIVRRSESPAMCGSGTPKHSFGLGISAITPNRLRTRGEGIDSSLRLRDRFCRQKVFSPITWVA